MVNTRSTASQIRERCTYPSTGTGCVKTRLPDLALLQRMLGELGAGIWRDGDNCAIGVPHIVLGGERATVTSTKLGES